MAYLLGNDKTDLLHAPTAATSPVQLPLECAGAIIDVTVSMLGLRGSLQLRLVNKFFDREICMSIARKRLLNEDQKTLRQGMMSHHCPDCHMKTCSDMSGFLARYTLYCGDLKDGRWDSDMPTFICCILDRLAPEDGFPPGERFKIATELWRHILEYNIGWDKRLMFPESLKITETPMDTHLSVARLLFPNVPIYKTDHQAYSELLGSALHTAIKTRQHVVVRQILESNVDLNKPEHSALETACRTGDGGLVRLLLSPQFNLECGGAAFEAAVNLAIRLDSTEIATLLLDRATGRSLLGILHDGFRFACFNGNKTLVRQLMDMQPDMDLDPACRCALRLRSIPPRFCESPLEVAAWRGHVELLRELLQAHGDDNLSSDLRRRIIHQATIGGHPAAVLLVWTSEADLSVRDWISVLDAQAWRGECFISLWEALRDHGIFDIVQATGEKRPRQDIGRIMRRCCRFGAVEVVRMLLSLQVPVEGPFYDLPWKEGPMDAMYGPDFVSDTVDQEGNIVLRGRVPLLEAIAHSQSAVVALLLEFGAFPVDPLQSCWAKLFKAGKLPKSMPPHWEGRRNPHQNWHRLYLGDCGGCR